MTTLTGHKNTDQLVANELCDKDLWNFCKANHNFCKDDNFWRDRFFKKYGFNNNNNNNKNNKKSEDKTWKTFYLQTVYYLDKSKNDVNEAMMSSAEAGHRDLVDFFIQQGANNWNRGMYNAARGGHRHLVDFFIQQGADDWNWAMMGAEIGASDV